MPETVNPSNADFYAAIRLVDGRESIVLDELVRRLQLNLNDKIAYLNTTLNLTGSRAIPKPKGYHVAPAVLTDEYINTVLVSVAVNTESHSPGVFRNELQAVVYSIDRRIEKETQIGVAWDRSGAIRGVLYHFLLGCVDASNRQCWRLLEPTGKTMLPEPYSEYAGVACYYRVVLDPTFNNWI